MDPTRVVKIVASGIPNRKRIVEAAQNLFYKKGYAGTSFSDIAQAADVPRGNFYYYFKTKDEILCSVIENRSQELKAQLEDWDRNILNPRDRLLAFLDYPLEDEHDIIRYGCPLGTLATEMCKSGRDSRSKTVVLLDVVVQWLETQFVAIARTNEARLLAMHTLARLQGAIVLANAYNDSAYLHYELAKLKDWIKAL